MIRRPLIALITFALCSQTTLAQQGDKRGQKQPERVPRNLIPPSPYLNQKDALTTFQLAEGFVIEPITAEDSLTSPVALTFDADNRVWVVEMTQYMVDLDGNYENKPTGRIKVLEDTTGDGFHDKVTVVLDQLVLPRALAVTSDGLLYTSGDTLYFTKRSGLKLVGDVTVVDKDYAKGGNAEHKANGLLYSRDNWYYNAKSAKRYRRINDKWVIEKTAFRGQWGIAQDDAGRLYHNSNSRLLTGDQFRPNLFSHHPYFTPKSNMHHAVSSNRVYPIRVNPGLNRAYDGKTLGPDHKLVNATAASGMTIYRGNNFPDSYHGNAFVSEPGGNLVKLIDIKRGAYNKPIGSHPLGQKEFLASTDEWFRPVNLYTGPDGTLWMIDMYFGLLQHKTYMTTYLRDQYASRGLDKPQANNGRLYRIRYTGKKVRKPLKLSGMTIKQLINALNHPNGTTRDMAQRLIVERISSPSNANRDKDIEEWNSSILRAVKNSPSPQLKLYGLWISESLQNIPAALLELCLQSENSDVVSSAIELAHFAASSATEHVLAGSPNQQTLHSYLFALGKIANARSHKKALSLIKEHSDIKLTREAYISGLGLNISKVAQLVKINDPALKKLVTTSLSRTSPNKPQENKLSLTKDQKIRHDKGKAAYAICAACHQSNGQGLPNTFPPLVTSDWVQGDKPRLIKTVLDGLTGPIKVNGEEYNGTMMPFRDNLDDQTIADILTYLRNENSRKTGKKFSPVSKEEVNKVRNQ